MLALIAIWALAEGIVFFIVADVPIMALGIRSGVRKAMAGAFVAAVFAALGGAVIWLWAGTNPKEVIELMLAIPGIDAELLESAHGEWVEGGAIAMAAGSFAGVPYKLYALAAGSQGSGFANLTLFVFASIIARLPRFLLVALVSGWAGPRLVTRFGSRPVWTGFALAWAGFYAVYWSAMGFL